MPGEAPFGLPGAPKPKPTKATVAKAKNAFRDSLVTNIEELLGILPSLNLTNDPKVTEFAETVRRQLCQTTAQNLRENDSLRASVAKEADSILSQIQEFIA